MEYTPGTKLSYANDTERCTVLTDGMVLLTRVWGEDWYEQMKLEDWLILAEGEEQVHFSPKKKSEFPCSETYCEAGYDAYKSLEDKGGSYYDCWDADKKARNSCKNHYLKAIIGFTPYSSKPAFLDPVHYVGTKFSWTDAINPEKYRIAIQTRKGVLEVKTDEGPSKKFFESPASWKKTLRKGPIKITSPATDDILSSLPETFTDSQKLRELERRFKVRSECLLSPMGDLSLTHKTANKVGIYRKISDPPTYLGYYYSPSGEELMVDSDGNSFKTFYGAGSYMTDGMPTLVVYYRGRYLNVSCLY
jgi:hypothetical protein